MIIDDNFLSDESKQFIKNYVLSRHFPLYMQEESVKGDETILSKSCRFIRSRT